jgi:hypothetical protein
MADDAACFLTTVLQGMQAKRHKVRSIGNADAPENSALLFQFVVIKRVSGGHLGIHQGSSESS